MPSSKMHVLNSVKSSLQKAKCYLLPHLNTGIVHLQLRRTAKTLLSYRPHQPLVIQANTHRYCALMCSQTASEMQSSLNKIQIITKQV